MPTTRKLVVIFAWGSAALLLGGGVLSYWTSLRIGLSSTSWGDVFVSLDHGVLRARYVEAYSEPRQGARPLSPALELLGHGIEFGREVGIFDFSLEDLRMPDSDRGDIDWRIPDDFLSHCSLVLGKWECSIFAPVWTVIGLCLCYPAILLWLRLRRQLRANEDKLCARCQYDLTGNLSGVCPECGNTAQVQRKLELSAASRSGPEAGS